MVHVTSLTSENLWPYECLSYTWGDPSDSRMVTLCPRVVQADIFSTAALYPFAPVTANLEAALRHLRSETEDRVLWIDSLSINQDDLEERASQVGMMREIYAKAKEVSVWLGKNEETSLTLHLFAKCLEAEFVRSTGVPQEDILQPSGFGFDASQVKSMESMESDAFSVIPHENALVALADFFDLPWFRRSWVLQEVNCATRVKVLWGRFELTWSSIILAAFWQGQRATEYLKSSLKKRVQHRSGYLPELWLSLAQRGREDPLAITDILFRAREFNATDPRDKIFALLGLGRETRDQPSSHSQLTPNYSKSKTQVYADFTKAHIIRSNSLELLSAVDIFTEDTEGNQDIREVKPGWVPDFDRSIPTIRLLGYPKLYNAAGATTVQYDDTFSESSRWLPLKGFELDRIGKFAPGDFIRAKDFGLTLGSFELPQLYRNMVVPLDHYPTGDDVLQAFILTLTCVGYADPNDDSPEAVLGRILPSSTKASLEADFAAFWKRYEPSMSTLPEARREHLESLSEDGNESYFGYLAGKACVDRRFFVSERGYIGLCPRESLPGDHVVVLYGGSVPYVLRFNHVTAEYYFVGECYVHGMMDGAALEEQTKRSLRPTTFCLS
ncbi:HET-domain-containing protein [Aulographum hederae CBS 113979]|uniref:HET-domain-containing protein n=1 Tax=Aulographum hederae CBS 113979 TaxID=1176131 RepID=A0A6G1HFV4_9PEZI|nr:HET-domain-containing protein [Aulographum hederae CBS 113979]